MITGDEITKENQDAIQKQLSFFNIALLIFALIALIVGAVHHLQHVLDRRRATHARDGAAARDRRQPAPGDGPGVRRVGRRRRAGVRGRRRRRVSASRSGSRR